MTFSPTDVGTPLAKGVTVTAETLVVELSDGRALSVPLAWYPRLAHSIAEERADWQLIGGGQGIHWPRLDEDISVEDCWPGDAQANRTARSRVWLASRHGAANLTRFL